MSGGLGEEDKSVGCSVGSCVEGPVVGACVGSRKSCDVGPRVGLVLDSECVGSADSVGLVVGPLVNPMVGMLVGTGDDEGVDV